MLSAAQRVHGGTCVLGSSGECKTEQRQQQQLEDKAGVEPTYSSISQ